MVVVPQPVEMVTPEISLVLGVTVSGAMPVKVNVTGAIAPLTMTFWLPPPVIEIVGAAGGKTITVAEADVTCA